eukprot:TRINITY_DN15314_c0_g1::TRINITY_DN15314_c0_g1_i1::g.30862::m.30862 TRINITY_DN15314_c0_g1::TRINITY_DN15314_c0_g1_i1::g.30862  ORF type:complete len:341 (+),score=51.29,HSBP1/PF06825.7/1.6e+03,HSBP1/PF06825.7/0.27,HSBP1/PF06825.7/5.3,DivIC/PF04977.10/0.015,DivIC/PF04977.10/93,Mnd1/PF03962.10/2.8,Mnd1/PF03962.10/2.3,BLOC1_2/PF10046.4/0.12,BLOC1_2/PF10046.4/3e+02,BLOC1_2/PF10046.4/2.7e+03,DUF3166/PF11365.3/0.06,SF-assemblin/PF06705.6/0.1,SF-assemblin/PF06705.6/1.8e+02,IncA/PF04156.9/1.9,IncA/PF04156.
MGERNMSESEVEFVSADQTQSPVYDPWWTAPDVHSGPIGKPRNSSTLDLANETSEELRNARMRRFCSQNYPTITFGSFTNDDWVALDAADSETQLLLKRVETLEKENGNLTKELQEVRQFTRSLYTQIRSQHDFVHDGKIFKGIEEKTSVQVSNMVYPHLWNLSDRLLAVEANIMYLKDQSRLDDLEKQVQTLQADFSHVSAGLGEEKVKHVEVVGDGLLPDGQRRRRLLTEEQLADHATGGVRESWLRHSTTATTNENFKQIALMFDQVILPRLDNLEKNVTTRMDLLEKRVTVMHSLFNTLRNDRQNHPTPTLTPTLTPTPTPTLDKTDISRDNAATP